MVLPSCAAPYKVRLRLIKEERVVYDLFHICWQRMPVPGKNAIDPV